MSDTLFATMNRQQRRQMERDQRKRLSQPRASREVVNVVEREQLARSALPGSLSLARPADNPYDVAVLEQFDSMAGIRNALRMLAGERGEWAGYPMPMENCPITVEPTYPKADEIMAIGQKTEKPDEIVSDPTTKIRNRFWSWRWRRYITVWERQERVDWGVDPVSVNPSAMLLQTLYAADAWGIEQESNAIHTLGGLLRHRQFKQYLMTGMFMERSKRSGVHYLFRKLRPTLAISEKGPKGMHILAALCLHPIGYYNDSWAGAMCPTDDVLAHLMLCRGDEHLFWRRANQHPSWVPQSGLV